MPPLAFLAIVALVRDAEGVAVATFTPMLALPVIWFALYGTRTELAISIGLAGAVIAAPDLIDPDGASLEPAATGVWIVVLALVGYASSAIVRERERLLDEVAKLARTDPLTGLANRRGWGEVLRREIARADRDDGPLSVALVDIDRFKEFNDHYGHAAGDRLLKQAASSWSSQIREMDLIARHGGEEFAVLLPGARAADATSVVERVRSSAPAGITISGGVAQRQPGESPEALLARADAAMYRAKREGRDAIRVAQRSATSNV